MLQGILFRPILLHSNVARAVAVALPNAYISTVRDPLENTAGRDILQHVVHGDISCTEALPMTSELNKAIVELERLSTQLEQVNAERDQLRLEYNLSLIHI